MLVVTGLVASFAVFTLIGGSLLSLLNLPDDLLHWLGITAIALVGVSLLIPAVAHMLERPFVYARIPRLNRDGSALGLGAALGLVFVPCAGPILAAITVLAATSGVSWGLVALTLAFSVGVAIPLMVFALAGHALGQRITSVREKLPRIRQVSGAILVLTAIAIATNVVEPLQRVVPETLASIQENIETNDKVRDALDALAGHDNTVREPVLGSEKSFDDCEAGPGDQLQDCGPMREFSGIVQWLNTPDNQPLTAADLEGKVILVDFWTYTCINCQRTFPYITEWHDRYADEGLVIIGVHTPEFAFEKVEGNVVDAAERFGIDYPIAMDNDFETWREWDQRFWPAHYLIDQTGTVRQVHYGEGAYAQTEALIQELLETPALDPVTAPFAGGTRGQSLEAYLGHERIQYIDNDTGVGGVDFLFTMKPSPALHYFSLGGTWFVDAEAARAVEDAELTLHFFAADVHLVLGGEGTLTVSRYGDPDSSQVIEISGTPKLYTLYAGDAINDYLHLEFTPGIEAYAFTFG